MQAHGLLTASGGTVGPQAPGMGQAPFISGDADDAEADDPGRTGFKDEVDLTSLVATALRALGFVICLVGLTGSAASAGACTTGACTTGADGETGATIAIGLPSGAAWTCGAKRAAQLGSATCDWLTPKSPGITA